MFLRRENGLMRGLSVCGFILVFAAGSADFGYAQGYGFDPNARQVQGPIGRPTVSPYLNLLRNNSPVLNYYGLVRPQVDIRANEYRLQSELNRLERQSSRGAATMEGAVSPFSELGTSGHGAQFMRDMRGRPEALPMEMRERDMKAESRYQRTGRYTTSTGHGAYFGNQGTFFRQR